MAIQITIIIFQNKNRMVTFDTRSEELIAKNVESASVATAFARNDFPVPGGPYSRIPDRDKIACVTI